MSTEPSHRFHWTIRYGLPLLVLAAGAIGTRAFILTRPSAGQAEPPERAVPVNVIYPELTDYRIVVDAMGDVVPARQTELRAQVGGRVRWRHPALETGGRFVEGEVLVEIEPEDYAAALAEARSAEAQARLHVLLERQRQSVAAEEWRQSGQSSADAISRSVALREPHLEAALRAAEAASNAVARAERNLDRTRIRAPYDGMVLAAHAEIGAVLAPQSPVAGVAATDVFHVRAALPLDALDALPPTRDGRFDPPLPTRLTLSSGGRVVAEREGRVLRLTGELTRPGRMAGVLIAIETPLDGKAGRIPLGAYAHCAIEGRVFKDTWILPRTVWRDGGMIWVAGDDDRLETRTPVLIRAPSDAVLLGDGLDAATRVISTELPAAVPGMLLKVLNPLGDVANED